MRTTLQSPRLRPAEAAALLRISVRTLRRWANPHSAPLGIALAPLRVGGRLFYTEELLVEWQRQCDQRRQRWRREVY